MNGIHEWIENKKNIHDENYDQVFYIVTKLPLVNRLIFQSFYKIYNKITGIQTSLTDKKCLVSHTEFEIQ